MVKVAEVAQCDSTPGFLDVALVDCESAKASARAFKMIRVWMVGVDKMLRFVTDRLNLWSV